MTNKLDWLLSGSCDSVVKQREREWEGWQGSVSKI